MHDRELQAREGAAVEDETGPGHLRRALEIQQAELLADLRMLPGRGQPGFVAPRPDHLVVALRGARWHRLVGQVGDVEEGALDPLLHLLEPRVLFLHLVGQGLEPRAKLRLLFPFERAHLLRRLPLLGALRFARLDELPPFGGEGLDGRERLRPRGAAGQKPPAHLVQVRHNPLQVEHGVRKYRSLFRASIGRCLTKCSSAGMV